MIDAVIVSTARTGLAKSWKGAFKMTYGASLGGHAVRHPVARAGVYPGEVEDCIMGSSHAEGPTGGNIARVIALRAGLPVTIGGVTVNRFCSSGLQAIAVAAQRVILEGAPAIVAGGVENISCVQNEANQHMRRDPWLLGANEGRSLAGVDLAELGIPDETQHRAAYLARMAQATGREQRVSDADWTCYLVFNMFHLVGILQGVAKRARQGNGSNARAVEAGRRARPWSNRPGRSHRPSNP